MHSLVPILFPIYAIFFLACGWAVYIGCVLSELTINWAAVASAIVALLLFATVLHKICAWLYLNYGGASHGDRRWKFAWSKALVGSIVLMFCAGTAMIGVVHQTSWLFTSKAPLLYSSTRARGNLKMIGMAVHNYNAIESTFPAGATFDETGRPLHSWVTRLLPYMDGPRDSKEVQIYNSVKQALPWDDPLNRQPFQQPLTFITNSDIYSDVEPVDFNAEQYALAHYAANMLVMGPNLALSVEDITDGTSNTFMVGEVNAKFRPWGDPLNFRDVALGINKSPVGFGSQRKGAYFLRADGSVQFISENIDLELLKATATPNGGERDTIPGGLIE